MCVFGEGGGRDCKKRQETKEALPLRSKLP